MIVINKVIKKVINRVQNNFKTALQLLLPQGASASLDTRAIRRASSVSHVISLGISLAIALTISLMLVTPSHAVLIEFTAHDKYSSFSFEGEDLNNDGYLVYDEVERFVTPIYDTERENPTYYEMFGWGVFDINNGVFLNDLFSAWEIPPTGWGYTEEEWITGLRNSLGPSSQYTIEEMSSKPVPPRFSKIIFGENFNRYYSPNTVSVAEPAVPLLFAIGLLGLMTRRRNHKAGQ